jgi:hypothetical protein
LVEFDAEVEEEKFENVLAVVFSEILGFLLKEGLVFISDRSDGRWG